MFEGCPAAAQASYSGLVWFETGDDVGVGSIWGFGAGDGRHKSGRPSGIVESRRSDRGSGNERSGVFGGSAGAADAANQLRVAL